MVNRFDTSVSHFEVRDVCEEFKDISITRLEIAWYLKQWIDALAFKHFYFSAIFHSELSKMANLTQCPSHTRRERMKTNIWKQFKRSVGRYGTVVDIRADAVIRSKQTTLNHHVLFLFTFFRFVILCIYLGFLLLIFVVGLSLCCLYRSFSLSLDAFCALIRAFLAAALHVPTHSSMQNAVKIRLKSTNQFDMRRFVLSACTNDRFRIYESLLPFGRYVRNESRFFLITMRNTYPIRSVSTSVAQTKKNITRTFIRSWQQNS